MFNGFSPSDCFGRCSAKLLDQRHIITWDSLHISKQVRKKSKKYFITINKDTDQVVKAAREYHGKNHIITDALINTLMKIRNYGGQIERVDGNGKTVKKIIFWTKKKMIRSLQQRNC